MKGRNNYLRRVVYLCDFCPGFHVKTSCIIILGGSVFVLKIIGNYFFILGIIIVIIISKINCFKNPIPLILLDVRVNVLSVIFERTETVLSDIGHCFE